jgi:CheY-like chemotaxis protein
MDTQAQLIGGTTAASLTFDDSKVAQENLDLLRFRPQVRAAAIYDARGEIFARYAPNATAPQFPTLPRGGRRSDRGARSRDYSERATETSDDEVGTLVESFNAMLAEIERRTVESEAAPDARLGIALARAHLPRVILMDLNLPGISGSDALKILRANPDTARIPVIAVTANAMPRDIARGLSDGFFRYVTKPLVLDELNKAIDSALESTRPAEGPSE